jgi:hypothetical protein
MIELAEKERKESEPYKDLFKRTDGKPFCVQLHEVERKMVSIALDYCDILRENGYKVNDDTWQFMLALPIMVRSLEKEIEEKEGHVCCVDKTYHILHKEFMKILTK